MSLYKKYLKQTEFESMEDFLENYKILPPENFNFAYDIMDKLAEDEPDKICMYWCNTKGEEHNFTYAELMKNVNKTANLFKKYGIKKGDAVMLILKRHYQFWFSIIALCKIGAVVIPATHLLTQHDLEYRNNAASVKMIVCTSDDNTSESVEASEPESPTLEIKMLVNGNREGWVDFNKEQEEQSDVFVRPTGDEATNNNDRMLIYFTSGTTGYPKMVAHDFLYPLGHIATAVYWHMVEPDGVHWTVSDTGWGKAAWGKLYGQWMADAPIMVYDYDKFIPKDMLKIIDKYKVTTFCAPPTIYRFLISEDLTEYDLSSLKNCTIAGEPLNPEVYNKFYELTGLKLREGYGQTETTMSLATFPWMEPRPGSMGVPSPGYKIELLNEEGRLCEAGEVGEIVIETSAGRSPGIFLGYYRDEELTRARWHDNYYHTGDTAWRDEDGYYWFVGRADDVIKSSGYRIGPFEVESALLEHPAVLETAITGVPDPMRGQIVKATVILAKGYEPSEALVKELQNHVKHVTAPYKYPRIIEFVDELPKTISGKIRRVQIRQEDAQK